MNRAFITSLFVVLAGCTAAVAAPDAVSAPAAAPVTTQRALFDMGPAYFPGALPHGETLVGAPPSAGSEALARDERLSAAGLALYGTERFKLAGADADLGPGGVPAAFSCTAGVAISELVATYWTNFAKRGDPNGPGVPAWPEFTASNRPVMYFHDTATVGPVPSAGALAVLDSYFAWRRTPEGTAWAK